MAAKADSALGFTTPQVVRLAAIADSTLNYWVREQLCGPSLIGSAGQRYTRYWSVRDLVMVRSIKALREAGCSLAKVREVRSILESEGSDIAASVLFWNGHDVLRMDSQGEIVSLLADHGQRAFAETVVHFLTLPIRAWTMEAETQASEFDLATIEGRRNRRRVERPRTAVASLGA